MSKKSEYVNYAKEFHGLKAPKKRKASKSPKKLSPEEVEIAIHRKIGGASKPTASTRPKK